MSDKNTSETVGKMVGIDLGTTNTVVAYMSGKDPEVLFNRDGKPLTRSAVSLRRSRRRRSDGEDELLVGNPAVRNLPMAPEDTIISIKRLMGIGFDHPEAGRVNKNFAYRVVKPSGGTEDAVRVVIGDKEYAPEDISAMILRAVKEDAEERLGEEVTHAVITVPAYFDQSQKAATLKAGIKAGLRVLKLLDEPTAAAIAYGMDEKDSGEWKYAVVYDLGGGTFDVSVLMWGGVAFVPMNIEGDMWLGGDNFDQEIIDFVKQRVVEEYGIDPSSNMRFMGKLKIAAQEAKESLSYQDSTEIIIDNLLMDENNMPIDVFVDITREQYEDMIRPYVVRSIELVEKAIDNANLTLDDIHYILLAGNASMTPLVQEMVTEKFGEERLLKRKHPKHCVAEGAAIVAKVYHSVHCPECGFANPLDAETCKKCGQVLNKLFCPECDTANEPGATVCANCSQALDASGIMDGFGLPGISSRHYGIQYQGDEFAIFVRKNDPIPTTDKHTQTFQTRHPNQRMLYVPVFGGTDTEAASNNEKQGEAFAILPPGLPSGTEVSISLWLDENEVFELSAELGDGTQLDPWIVKGDVDHKAIQTLETLENEIRGKEGDLSTADNKLIEESRERVFEDLKSGNFEDAAQEVEDLRQMLDAMGHGGGGGPVDALHQEAKALIQFTEFLTNEYRWLLGAQKCSDLKAQADGLNASLQSGDEGKIRREVEDLKNTLDNLPKVLQLLLGLKMAIAGKVEPVEPTKAIQLKDDLAEAERTLQEDPQKGMAALARVAKAVTEAIEGLPATGPRPCPAPGCDGTYVPGVDAKCTRGHNVSLFATDNLESSVH